MIFLPGGTRTTSRQASSPAQPLGKLVPAAVVLLLVELRKHSGHGCFREGLPDAAGCRNSVLGHGKDHCPLSGRGFEGSSIAPSGNWDFPSWHLCKREPGEQTYRTRLPRLCLTWILQLHLLRALAHASKSVSPLLWQKASVYCSCLDPVTHRSSRHPAKECWHLHFEEGLRILEIAKSANQALSCSRIGTGLCGIIFCCCFERVWQMLGLCRGR